MIWRGFILLAIALVTALTVLVGRRDRDDAEQEGTREPPQPGYYMTDAQIVETGPDGAPRYRMAAERIVQNPQDQSIRLQTMKLDYRAGPEREWTLTARNGYVPPASRTIDLSGDVQITGLPVEGSVPAVVRTERMQLDTVANVATSRERVDIVWGERRLSTIGLKADLKAEKLKLESSVHGRFVR